MGETTDAMVGDLVEVSYPGTGKSFTGTVISLDGRDPSSVWVRYGDGQVLSAEPWQIRKVPPPIPACQGVARFDSYEQATYVAISLSTEFGSLFAAVKHDEHFHVQDLAS